MDKVIEFSHELIKKVVSDSSVTIDMTLGNGFDSLFLSKISKKVYAFDIQEEAFVASKKRLKDENNVVFIFDSHENVLNYVKEKVKAVIFNLGYLPSSNKKITTSKETTIKAISEVLKILDKFGLIVIVLYPGFIEGKKEALGVEEYLMQLNQKEYNVLKYQFINQINDPPYLIAVEKR